MCQLSQEPHAAPSPSCRSNGSDGPVALTRREREVLHWIALGKSDWQIGCILHISAKTVNYHAENVKRKFAVSTRVQAAVSAMRCGLL